MREGFYRIAYGTELGRGLALVAFDTGRVIGTDITGSVWDGTYEFNPANNCIDAKLKLTIPPGVFLVQGVPAQDREHVEEFSVSFPRETPEHQIEVPTSLGAVQAIIKFLRHFPD